MRPPDLKVWLAHSEDEQIDAVQKYHRKRKLDPPNPLLHATFHVVVENQVALGEETPVKATLVRLMEEGLDRHDAVHAIGSILVTHLYEGLRRRHGGRLDLGSGKFATKQIATILF